jgi:hypothetical protein
MTTNGFGRLTTSARAVPEPINEAAFQRMIMDLARYNGWRVYHTHDSRRSEPGFPDLVIARRNSPLWLVELKSPRGRMTPAQWSWIDTLRTATGVRSEVWRPDDFDRIAAILSRDRR